MSVTISTDEEDYINAVAIADMAATDDGRDKTLMDILWRFRNPFNLKQSEAKKRRFEANVNKEKNPSRLYIITSSFDINRMW